MLLSHAGMHIIEHGFWAILSLPAKKIIRGFDKKLPRDNKGSMPA